MDLVPEKSLRWLVSRYAHLLHEYGSAIDRPPLVLPTGEFFPDEFTLDPDGVMRVAKRLLAYAPVKDDVEIGLGFLEPEDTENGKGGCSSGACGTGGGAKAGVQGGDILVQENESDGRQRYAMTLATRDTGNPVLMTTALARATGAIVLAEAGEEIEGEAMGAEAEITASAIGLGVLMTSGAYVYGKSCGGVNVRQATHLSVMEHATLLALFLRVNSQKPSAARAHLETTQREAFDEALRWVDSNPNLVEALRVHPETLVDGVFPVEETKGLLGRLFAKRGPSPSDPPLVAPKKRERSEAEQRRLNEAKALVEEALRAR